jgi:hypothetical protein
MDKINQLEVLCAEARVEGTAFYEKGNKSAGTRLRAKMAEIAVLCKATRVDVQAIKNADK